MAVSKVFLTKNLQLRLNTGLDEELKPIYRTRSFSNVKPGSDNVDLFEVAHEIAALQEHTLSMVRRVDEVELEEDGE